MEARQNNIAANAMTSDICVRNEPDLYRQMTAYKAGRPTRAMSQAETLLISLLYEIGQQADIDLLSRTMSLIDLFPKAGNYAGIDRVISRLDVRKLEPLACVTLLRTTLPFHGMLRNWTSFRDKTYRHINRKRYDADMIMHDLIDVDPSVAPAR